jgi:glutamate racemase
LATPATVSSESYVLELAKISEAIQVAQQACPLWVPIIEAGEHESQGADFFVDKYLQSLLSRDPKIDTLVLGCTHYPLLLPKIEQWLKQDKQVRVIAQGSLVADSLADYLKRHPEYRDQLSQNGTCIYLTTEDAGRFSESASLFLDAPVQAQQICLN